MGGWIIKRGYYPVKVSETSAHGAWMITVDEFLVLGGQVGGHGCRVSPPYTLPEKFRAALDEALIKVSVVLLGKQ